MSSEVDASIALDVQTLWTMVCAALVLFMQAGFCCVEAGSARQKNSVNVALKNVVDLCLSFPAFFLLGYALMFGDDIRALVGQPRWGLAGVEGRGFDHFVYQAAFCSTAATIVSGGVAERCRFLPYVFVSVAVALLIYPVFGHWVWGGGWLAQLGYHDFAGSSVVHMVGAGVTLAGIQVVGPRTGRFDAEGRPQPVAASSMPMVALGVVILAFGWIGFNGGSAPLGVKTGLIVTNTLLAASVGGLGALLVGWAYGGLARVDLVLNGVLGGLVAVTACADVVSVQSAALVGLAGGLSVVVSTYMMVRLRLDDVVGAVPVHGAAGIVGVLLTGILATEATLQERGLGRVQFVQVQVLGALACVLWSYLVGLLVWWLAGTLTKLRVGPVEEAVGLNFSEHQVESPVFALTRAAAAVEAGARPDQLDMDSMPDSQFEQLAQAIRALAGRSEVNQHQAQRWSEDLETISGLLDLNHQIGRDFTHRYEAEVSSVDQSLAEIIAMLVSKGEQPGTRSGAIEAASKLRRRLHLLSTKVPASVDSWREINRMTARLDRLAGDIRGGVHGVH